MNLFIVIPAYNEEKVIGQTLDSLPKKMQHFTTLSTVVVDDGSQDKTFLVAKKRKVVVLRHILNRGLGAALKTGLDYARNHDADIAVTFDADGQHHYSDIEKVVRPIIKKKVEVVIGTRFKKHGRKVPKSRTFINFVSNIITLAMFQIWTTDSQSGFRAFSKKALEKIELSGQRMEVSSEFFKEIKFKKLKFKEVPIKAIYTDYSLAKGQSLTNSMNVFGKLTLLLFR